MNDLSSFKNGFMCKCLHLSVWLKDMLKSLRKACFKDLETFHAVVEARLLDSPYEYMFQWSLFREHSSPNSISVRIVYEGTEFLLIHKRVPTVPTSDVDYIYIFTVRNLTPIRDIIVYSDFGASSVTFYNEVMEGCYEVSVRYIHTSKAVSLIDKDGYANKIRMRLLKYTVRS